jgi:hypothetical protein
MSPMTRLAALAAAAATLTTAGCVSSSTGAGAGPAGASQVGSAAIATAPSVAGHPALPRPAHVVIVMMENHSFADVIGSQAAPYLTSLAAGGADFSQSFAITHPSQPNYLALFSGSTQGVTSDTCPLTFSAPNLAADLLTANKTFTSYSEDLPSAGSKACTAGNYARKHAPWTDFSNVPGSVSKPFRSWPAGNYANLPDVSFVIPNLCDDMHNCPVATGDAWIRVHLSGYATWAMKHNSLLIITWDEDDNTAANQIPTIFAGQHVKPGRYSTRINHYSVLRTIEDAFDLSYDGAAATASPITSIWAK